jgi:hypothetical protein
MACQELYEVIRVGDPFDAREQDDTISLLMIFIEQYQILVRRNFGPKFHQCAGLKLAFRSKRSRTFM